MRFMLLLNGDTRAESFEPPAPELIAAMDAYNAALQEAGVWVDADGLQPSAAGFRLANQGGTITITDGPFTDVQQVLFGYWLIEVTDRDAVLEWAEKVPLEAIVATGHGASVEVRQIYGLEDIPVRDDETGWRAEEEEMRLQAPPARDESKERWLMMFMADERSESGQLPEEKVFAEMGAHIGSLVESGVWIGGEGLMPSKEGATRISLAGGTRSVIDGPFAETKEMIAGYGIVQVDSRADVEAIARRGAEINGEGRSEIRRLW